MADNLPLHPFGKADITDDDPDQGGVPQEPGSVVEDEEGDDGEAAS